MERKRLHPREKKARPGSERLWGVLILTSLFLWSGCGEEPKAPVTAAKKAAPVLGDQKKPEPGKPALAPKAPEQKAEKKEEPEYTYNPVGKPDPFKPFIQLVPVKEARNTPLTPLQKYEISQLKLVAIISTADGTYMALVEDAAGKGYFLKKGTEIGKNDGKVTKIMKDRVIVEEVYQDISGKTKVNEIPLFLHRTEEGGGS